MRELEELENELHAPAERGDATMQASPAPTRSPLGSDGNSSTTSSTNSSLVSTPSQTKKKKFRARTQSEGAVWTRSSFTMHAQPQRLSDTMRNSEGSMPRVVEELLDNLDMTSDGRLSLLDVTGASDMDNESAFDRVQRLNREGCISLWLEQGEISARASELLEDAKLTLHGKEKNLYRSSARRLSEAQDPMLNSLGEKLSSKNAVTLLDVELPVAEYDDEASQPSSIAKTSANPPSLPQPQLPPRVAAPPTPTDLQLPDVHSPGIPLEGPRTSTNANDAMRPTDFFRPESATLYHEAVRWEGVLSRRSEWLRRLEKHYYVLEGKYLRRFASKEAYLASRDEPLLQESERGRRGSTAAQNAVSHLYILAGCKDSSSRANGFTFITEDKKTLQLTAPTPVEKVIWMRLSLEAIVAIPNLAVAPLDMEEFYAMLVVLYTAQSGQWRTDGDMAVTLPPPSEQVFTRFFRLLDKDIIFCSNYPPSVPFHGSFRGHAGVVAFMHEFAKQTIWTNFKIGGLSVEGSIAVASGKEEMENKRDGRKFIQNWVHKFMFYSDGRLARFEINGDVVAASAVFKVPGAATTLKLPQDFNEVDAEHGKQGTLLVHVMQGSGLKVGANNKKSIKEPAIVMALAHSTSSSTTASGTTATSSNGGGNSATHDGSTSTTNASSSSSSATATSTSSSTLSSLSMPVLTRKFSSGLGLLSGSSSSTDTSEPKINPYSTGAPRNVAQSTYSPMNPVWNKVITLPFRDVIGTCSLVMDLVDHQPHNRSETKIGLVTLNVAKYIMSSHSGGHDEEDAAMASDARWYTVSNVKGEYCGKIMVGITCRRHVAESEESSDVAKPRLRKSRSVVIDRHNPPTAQMLQWETPSSAAAHLLIHAMTPASTHPTTGSVVVDDEAHYPRRHGWANVKLSPETLARPQSDGATLESSSSSSSSAKKAAAVTSAIGTNGKFDSVICKENDAMHTFMVCGAPFTIPRHYQLIKVCGRGAYGIVIAATNTMTGGNVAIKKVIDCIWHPHQLKQILRESRLMRHLDHENLLSLMDLIPPPSFTEFRDVYMTVDLMEMDLHRVIYSKEVLLDDHIRYFLYQILSGLNHMHRAGVLHRDLKPSNLLINSDCQLKICDLGLARSMDLDDHGMTEYVVTRWYRAPELLLGSAYGEGVDLWAAGCIFAEMLGRKPLFPGETYVHQLQLIMNVLGVPEEHSFKENPQANKLKGRQLLSRTQAVAGIDVSTMFPNANPEGLDLLWKMLVFDVEKRITVQEALRHPYLAAYFDEDKESRPVERFQSFDLDGLDESELKELMFKEICHFHPAEMEKRARLHAENPDAIEKLPPGWVKRESRSVPGKFYYSNPKRGISTWIKEEMD